MGRCARLVRRQTELMQRRACAQGPLIQIKATQAKALSFIFGSERSGREGRTSWAGRPWPNLQRGLRSGRLQLFRRARNPNRHSNSNRNNQNCLTLRGKWTKNSASIRLYEKAPPPASRDPRCGVTENASRPCPFGTRKRQSTGIIVLGRRLKLGNINTPSSNSRS